jgi:hypothetical protein
MKLGHSGTTRTDSARSPLPLPLRPAPELGVN